jgi:hypothetical protein
MKHLIPLLAVLAAGVAASFAVASPPPGHGPQTGSSQTSTTSPGKSGQHGNAKCRPMNLKGTVAGGTITLNVTGAAGPRAKLLGDTATLQVGGKVSVQAWTCGANGGNSAPTVYLKQLHVGGSPHNFGSTTPNP